MISCPAKDKIKNDVFAFCIQKINFNHKLLAFEIPRIKLNCNIFSSNIFNLFKK